MLVPITTKDKIANANLRRWREHPVQFVRAVCDIVPLLRRVEVLEAFPHHQRLATKTCKDPVWSKMAKWQQRSPRLLSLAARQDFEPAQFYLAAFYLAHRGHIADGDPVAIAALKTIVAREMRDKFCTNARFVVAAARLYEEGGPGVPRDLAEARRLYQRMGPPSPEGCYMAEALERLAKMPANSTLDRQ